MERSGADFYDDDEVVRATTLAVLAQGTTVLQVYQFGADEREHVGHLLAMLAPREGALILDAGSGVGGVAALMQEARPDLSFVLLNTSAAQLELSPPQFQRLQGSFEAIPLPDAAVDVVMLNYALGHGRLLPTLAEARRALRAGGVLFIYDLGGEPQDLQEVGYRVYGTSAIAAAASALGFLADPLPPHPSASTRHMARHVDPDTLERVFGQLHPLALRFHLQET